MNVVVCICTCLRPIALERLLISLSKINYDGSLHVVVVDNDAEYEEGRIICEKMAGTYRWPLHSETESERGISYARNRAVNLAMTLSPDFIAMLDDDEWVEPQWLYELLRVQGIYDADVVGGPVRPVLTSRPSLWIERSNVLSRREYSDGTNVRPHGTGNFLIRRSCFDHFGIQPFDSSFAITGGEDTVFFLMLERLGHSMVWANKAVVKEELPSSRITDMSIIHRYFISGNSRVRAFRVVYPGLAYELARLLRTGVIFAVACSLIFFGLYNKAIFFRGKCLLARARGRWMAHIGQTYDAYKTIHGTQELS